jgi:hypothetical protein
MFVGGLIVCLMGAGPGKGSRPAMNLVGDKTPPLDGDFRVVRASKFDLVDPRTGITRATLAHQVPPNGWAGLHFYDNDGHPRVWIQVFEDGEASIAMLDSKGRFQSKVSIDNEGRATSALNQNEKYDYAAEMKRKGVDLTFTGE